MVNEVTIPAEKLTDGFLQVVGPLFEKLGLPTFVYYIHSGYIYSLLILVVLGVAGFFLVKKLRKPKDPSTELPDCVDDLEEEVQTEDEEAEMETDNKTQIPRILAAAHQHVGTRKDQQDSYGVSEPGEYGQRGIIAVVADGMGGLSNGRAVSSALVRGLLDGFRNSDPRMNPADLLLEQAVRANAGVNKMLRGAERSGSTLVSCVIRHGYMNFLTVGDSRIYLYRGGALIQLNREHIYQEELAGKAVNQETSLQQVRSDRQAHALTSYFGIGTLPAIDRNDEGLKLVNGDKILLASDGVFGTLTQTQMEAVLAQDVHAAAKTMGELILKANRAHQDNNTAVILEYRI